jgi:predicted DNA-binding transcriptional regulator YafY
VLDRSDFQKDIRNFKISRIKELNMSNKRFFEDNEFDIGEHFGRVWSIVPENKIYNVKLRFTAIVAFDVAAVQWHRTQKVTFEDDGSVILEFRVDGLNEIIWWILSYGDRVQVLAPKILREKITEIAQHVAETNKQESYAK